MYGAWKLFSEIWSGGGEAFGDFVAYRALETNRKLAGKKNNIYNPLSFGCLPHSSKFRGTL